MLVLRLRPPRVVAPFVVAGGALLVGCLLAAAMVVALAVAASRVMLGVHWFTDVVAGLAVSWGWCARVVMAWPRRLAHPWSRP